MAVATQLPPVTPLDTRTSAFYEFHASDVAARYEAVSSPVEPYFSAAFPAGSRVLDVGAGSGRDLARLHALGYDACGVEPSEGLRAQAVGLHPELAPRLVAGSLPGLGVPFGGAFDGILCSAVLMHVPEAELFDAAFAMRQALKPNGRLLLSVTLARTDVDADHRDASGRLFMTYAPDYLQLLFERIGFQQIGRWVTDDAMQRAGTRWVTLLFELRAGGAARAVDQIEGILNRDLKVATYKLALFRALAELAMREPRIATFRGSGEVGVPVRRLAELWLLYYWPLFASERLIPQSASEGKGYRNPVSFRGPLSSLMQHFKGQGRNGGLVAWQSACAAGALPGCTGR